MLHVAGSVCADCLHSARTDNDPDWGFMLTQLLHRHRPLPVLGNPWLSLATAQVCAMLTEIADTGSIPGLATASLELAPPDPIWKLRQWPRRPGCLDCDASVPEQLEQQFGGEVGDPVVLRGNLAESS